jgi:hypothetical protein
MLERVRRLRPGNALGAVRVDSQVVERGYVFA